MYRPTVRMDESYRLYVEDLRRLTGLDRNQIIRLMCFTAPFSASFRSKVEAVTGGQFIPAPWQPGESQLWKGQGE